MERTAELDLASTMPLPERKADPEPAPPLPKKKTDLEATVRLPVKPPKQR
jgi:hypothetical protein